MIYIHKGDDTDFNDNSFLTFNIITEKDLTNWQAKFVLNGLEKTFEDIANKHFELHYSNEETSQFKLGKTTNELRLVDEEGKIKTVTKNIDITITNDVVDNKSQLINLPILKDEGIEINVSLIGNNENGGTVNHNELLNRELANQHPIEAITNLQETLDNKANKDEIPNITGFITNEELENKGYLKEHQNISHLATKEELNTKQNILVSGTNIKTINNQSILGEGNIEIQSGSSSSINLKDIEPYIDGQWISHRAYLLSGNTLAVGQTQVIDVSEIVPQDEYNYEVLLFMYAYPKDTKNGTKCIMWMSTDYFGIDNYFLPIRIENPQDATNKLTQGATFNVVIGSKREIYVTPTAYDVTGVQIGINGYRRLGKAISNE